MTHYESRMEFIRNQMLNLYYNEKLRLVHNQFVTGQGKNVNYLLVSEVWTTIRSMNANPLLPLDNTSADASCDLAAEAAEARQHATDCRARPHSTEADRVHVLDPSYGS
ncbi:hypothetical protein [Paenibacillus sp. YYML68]|uniref:hypothetical protein n=1 Tax=Paenibacillus sp. YYML68 TaxID=2909250 RepID=UPI002492978C|nr:hypothetical protein [Paenibacillus sp. YYML68]